ncbi:PrsW family glutamic-type intramembrane protease [Micromonosporaceae bacterium B7E4]
MAVLMIVAACYGVWQVSTLGSWSRSVRFGALLLAMGAGLYASGAASVALQMAYTRGMAALTGERLDEVVATASYTVDPLIEELMKIAPLLLVALLHRKIRAQWGLTDFLLLGAATGAGFALVEALLRFSNEADSAVGNPLSGYDSSHGLSSLHFPGVPQVVTTWLPEYVQNIDLLGFRGEGLGPNLHLIWSALAGLGVGLVLRTNVIGKIAGLGLFGYAWIDHAEYNQRIVAPEDGGLVGPLSGVVEFFHGGIRFYILLALAVAVFLDIRVIRAGKAATADVLIAGERAGQLTAQALGVFATRGLPFTPFVGWKFALVRRSLMFAQAARTTPDTETLRRSVAAAAGRIDVADNAQAWKAARPSGAALRAAIPRGRRPYLPIVVWLILVGPVLLYFGLGTIPLTSFTQDLLTSAWLAPLVMVLSAAGLGWLGWHLVTTARRLPTLLGMQPAETAARAELRLLLGAGALATGALGLFVWVTGTAPDQPVVSNLHILDALAKALLITAILLAIAALFMFPPTGLAVAGGGSLLAASPALIGALNAAGAMGLLGILLMAASGGSDGGGGARDGTPRTNQAQNKQFSDAVQAAERELGRRLTRDQIRRVHDEITGQNMGYHEIVATILDMFGG